VSDNRTSAAAAPASAPGVHHLPGDDADLRARARAVWLESHHTGAPLSGADLGRLFQRTDRWGRKRRQEAKASLDTTAPAEPARLVSLTHAGPHRSVAAAPPSPPDSNADHEAPQPARRSRKSPTPVHHAASPEPARTPESHTPSTEPVPVGSDRGSEDVPLAFRRISAAAVIVVALVAAAASVLSSEFVGYMWRGCRGSRRRSCATRMAWDRRSSW